MNKSWEAKRMLASAVSNSQIDAAVEGALAAGATGAKVTGAGGGGFLLVVSRWNGSARCATRCRRCGSCRSRSTRPARGWFSMSTVTSGADRMDPALPRGIRAPLAVAGAVGAVVAVTMGVLFAGQATGSGLDGRVAAALELPKTSSSAAADVSVIVQTLADPIPAVVLILPLVAACLWCGRRRLAILAVAAPAAADVVVVIAKHLVGRTIHGGSLTYPSTHTAHSAVFAMVAALLAADLLDLEVIGRRGSGVGVGRRWRIGNGLGLGCGRCALHHRYTRRPLRGGRRHPRGRLVHWPVPRRGLGGSPCRSLRHPRLGKPRKRWLAGGCGQLSAPHGSGRPAGILACMGPDEVAARYGASAKSLQWYEPHAGNATGPHAIGLKVLGRLLDPFRTLAWVRHNDVVIVPGMGILEATLPLRPWGFPYCAVLACGHRPADWYPAGAGERRLRRGASPGNPLAPHPCHPSGALPLVPRRLVAELDA